VIQVILGGVSLAATVPALVLIEKWGRRRSLLVGAVAQASCALIAGVVGHETLASEKYIEQYGTAGLTTRNKQGGDVLIAFAVLVSHGSRGLVSISKLIMFVFQHVASFACWWGPTPCEDHQHIRYLER
jgi:SP family sugar:H+ symporter-like MFS transporter